MMIDDQLKTIVFHVFALFAVYCPKVNLYTV